MFAALGIPNREDEHLYRGGLPLLIERHPAPYYATAKHAGPWLLRNVCYQWRTLVESSPRMWSHIFIRDCHSRHTETLKTFIAYSGSSALHIYVRVQYSAPASTLEYESFRILAAESSRWHSASIYLFNFEHCASLEFLRPLSGNLPRLHTLKLSSIRCHAFSVTRNMDICTLAGSNNPFTSLPSLRYLDLSDVHVSRHLKDFDFHLAELRQLVLGRGSNGAILLQCKRLISLSLTAYYILPPSNVPLILPSPKHLDISHERCGLRDAVLTSLESLVINVCVNKSYLPALTSLLSSLQCDSLRRLVLISRSQYRSTTLSPETVIGTVTPFPRIESLSIVYSLTKKQLSDWSDLQVFSCLLNREEHDISPELRYLEIEVNVTDKAAAAPDGEHSESIIPAPVTLVEMLESRCRREGRTRREEDGTNTLREVIWRSNCELLFAGEDEKRVRTLEEKGLKFERFIVDDDDDAALALDKYFF
jgi:hypothetical protein